MIIGVIGGGAAGFFAAIRAREVHPDAKVLLFEKTSSPLAKVKISGGGRCNVTNGASHHRLLLEAYPRGRQFLKKAFRHWDNHDVMDWYEKRGVPLKIEKDLRVFPQSNTSEDIVRCLLSEAHRVGVVLHLNARIQALSPSSPSGCWALRTSGDGTAINVDRVIIATGGSPRKKGLEWLKCLGIPIVPPVPSLFSFNLSDRSICSLPGLSVPNALVRVEGTSLQNRGPLLITHWGMSGPAILVLSSFGARELHDKNYRFSLQVNWTGIRNHEQIRQAIIEYIQHHSNKTLSQFRLFDIPERLWRFLLSKAQISENKRGGELGKKRMNKLVDILSHDGYAVEGKTTFKEEFVTCGGIDLTSVNPNTMASRIHPGLYFAGEILDVDGITGGFNFQSAWTTGYIAGELK